MTAEIEAVFAASATVRGRQAAALGGPAGAVAVNPDKMVLYIKPPPVQGVVPASGSLTFDMDGPKTGYQWTVRRVTVSDATALGNSMGASEGGVYAGQTSPLLITPGNAEWIFPTFPNVANFSSDQLILQYGEHCIVQVTSANPGQSLVCSIAYQLYTPRVAAADIQV